MTVNEEEKAIVLAQLLAASPELSLSIGSASAKTYSKDEITKHVEALDEIGREFIKTQMEFMRAMSSGDLYKAITPAQVGAASA